MIFNTLLALLDTYKKDHLILLGKSLSAHLATENFNAYAQRKAEIIAAVVKTVAQDRHLKRLLSALSPAEYALLQENVYLPPTETCLPRDVFQAKYDYDYPQLSFDSDSRRRTKEDYPSPLLAMMSRSGSVPLELRERLQNWLSPPRVLAPQYIDEPELVSDIEEIEIQLHDCEPAALQDIYTLLQWVEQGKAKVSPTTGRPSASTLKVLSALLREGDYYPPEDAAIGAIRAFAWAQMLWAAKWVSLNGSQLQLTRKGQKALQTLPQEGLKQLWHAWQSTTHLHELHRVETIKGQKSRSRPLAAAAPAREAIGQVLKDLEPGHWITLSDFLDYLVASGQNYEVARYPYLLHLGEPVYDNLGEVHSWDYIEGRFARCVLLEYAATLGLIDVALIHPSEAEEKEDDWLWRDYGIDFFSRYDGLYALRLTPLGAWALGQKTTYISAVKPQAVLRVLSSDELILDRPVPAAVQLFLERIAEPQSAGLWRLSHKRLLKSLEGGLGMDQVIAFLTEAQAAPLPESVQHWLADIERRVSALKSQGHGLILACESSDIQRLIAQHPRLKKHCLPAGETHLVILVGQERVFRRELSKLGYVLPLHGAE